MENQEMQVYQSQDSRNEDTFKMNTQSIIPAGFKHILPNKNESNFNSVESLLTPEEQERFKKIMGSIDFINEDLSNILENPLNKEDQKRIEEILNDNTVNGSDSYHAKSTLQLNVDAQKMDRIKTIDRLLEEMKADGHAYIKNIASSKCKSKYTKTMKTLDELKAEMNKIEESLENSRQNRKVKSLTQESNDEK